MEIEKIPVIEIKPYEKNPRKNDKAVDIVAKSIKEKIYKVMGFSVTMIKECEVCGNEFYTKPSRNLKCCSFRCSGINRSRKLIGEASPNWKGGKEIHAGGWIWVYCPEQPRAHKNKVAEHRLVMEKHLGRYLTVNEIVHHLNGNKTDNQIINLELHTRSSHGKLHHPQGKRFGDE